MSRQIASLSSATQHAMPSKFGRKWGTKCLNTRFPLPTLLCAGYRGNLIYLFDFFNNYTFISAILPTINFHRITHLNSYCFISFWYFVSALNVFLSSNNSKMIIYIFISSLWCRGKARRWVLPLNTQCLQNTAVNGELSVLTHHLVLSALLHVGLQFGADKI